MGSLQKNKGLQDAVLFAIFILCFFIDLTGIFLHQIFGVAAVAVAVLHLLNHWNWVRTVSARFFGKTSSQARRYMVVDILILAGFVVIAVTGLVISTWLNLRLFNGESWYSVHVVASLATLGLLVVKLFAHSRWIITTARKTFARPARQVFIAAQAPSVVVSQDRRDFLKLAGIVGTAALLATGVTVKSQMGQSASPETQIALAGGDSPATGASSSSSASEIGGPVIASSTAQPAAPAEATASPSVSSSCRVVCNRGCSYPGRCRRYVDTNGNGLCDNGECMG